MKPEDRSSLIKRLAQLSAELHSFAMDDDEDYDSCSGASTCCDNAIHYLQGYTPPD